MATLQLGKHPLAQAIENARQETDKLFALLRPDHIYDRPVPERHRLIFYLGHVEAFDWNQIARYALNTSSFHPTFDRLFEAGIDPPVGQAPSDQPSDWPAVEQVREYVDQTRQRLDRMLAYAPDSVIHMALEHRLMHAETLAYLMHELPYDAKNAPGLGPDLSCVRTQRRAAEIPAGIATLGKRRSSGFGWDNEFEEHSVDVPAFSIYRHKVTNYDYLQFVEQGGPVPHFWKQVKGQWFQRGYFSDILLPPDWPVYVTYEQAAAYTNWKGLRLPTEAEFHRAAYGARDGREYLYPWGDKPPASCHGNFDFRQWNPVSAYAYPAGDSAFGVSQLIGNGWEWTSTAFHPFPGFQPEPNYPGYSANFFDSDHFVMKGASPRTASCFLRRSFRNWFRSNYSYAYATFRCVEG